MSRTAALPFMPRVDSGNWVFGPTMANMSYQSSDKTKSKPNSLKFTVLGICAGASMSSVSCILVRYRQQSPEEQLHMDFIRYEELALPLQVRSPILHLLRDYQKNPHAMLRVHGMIGHMIATSIKTFCQNHNIPLESIDLAATQADSIPPSVLPSSESASWKAGIDPKLRNWTAVVVEETGITTVTTIPTNRQSLARREPSHQAFIDNLFLRHPTKFRVCLTIDDFLTVTAIPPENSSKTFVSTPFAQCGPGTIFIDYVMRYATSNTIDNDENGSYGERGIVNENMVNQFMKTYDYTRRAAPQSMAVEMFGQHEVQSLIDECLFRGMSDQDVVATITRITADNIMAQYHRIVGAAFPGQKVDELFICGRGAKNMKIVDRLEEMLPDEVITKPFEDIGIPGDAKGAVYCAHLGFETALRQAEVEMGHSESDPQGQAIQKLVKGKRWDAVYEQICLFGGGKRLPPAQRIAVSKT